MTRQLATMVASGMSILRSFHVLEDQTENEKLKEILGQVRQDIEAVRSEERRVGKECSSPCRSRWSPYH